MLSDHDTIATGGTEADQVFSYMLDNHSGVASAILNCAGKPTIIHLYLDLACPNGLRGTVEPMPNSTITERIT